MRAISDLRHDLLAGPTVGRPQPEELFGHLLLHQGRSLVVAGQLVSRLTTRAALLGDPEKLIRWLIKGALIEILPDPGIKNGEIKVTFDEKPILGIGRIKIKRQSSRESKSVLTMRIRKN
jgi:hypothetical protein